MEQRLPVVLSAVAVAAVAAAVVVVAESVSLRHVAVAVVATPTMMPGSSGRRERYSPVKVGLRLILHVGEREKSKDLKVRLLVKDIKD